MARPPSTRLLVVGWDGADWAVARPLMAAGRLPHLARVVAAGAAGDLAAHPPLLSPVTWTTVATGKRADRHGVLGTLVVDPADGLTVRPPGTADRTAAAVWDVARRAGRRVHCVNWPATHPAAAPPGGGVTVSDAFAVTLLPDAVAPASVAGELNELRVSPAEVGVGELLPSGGDNWSVAIGRAMLAQAATVHAVTTHLVEHHPWDLAAVVYPGIGLASAAFMAFHPPRQPHVPPADFDSYGDVVARAYQLHDLMLGRLVELAGPDAIVMVVSDHGFRTGPRRQAYVPRTADESAAVWHRPRAMLAAAGPGIAAGATVDGGRLVDVAPTVLALLGLPVGRDMAGRPLRQAFGTPITVDEVDSHAPPAAAADPGPDTAPPNGPAEAEVQHLLDLGYTDPAAAGPTVAERRAASVGEANRFNLARSLMDGGHLAAAADLLTALAAGDPDHPGYATELLEALYGLNRWADARRLAQGLWDRGHRVVAIIFAMARIDLGERRLDSALAHLRQAQEALAAAAGQTGTDPTAAIGTGEMHVMFGDVYTALGNYPDADRAYRQALGVDDEDEAAWTGRARAALAMGRPGEAVAHGRRAVAARPESAAAHFNLGVALAALDDRAGALAYYKRSLAIDPTVPVVYRRLIDLCRTDPTPEPGLADRCQAELDALTRRRSLARQGRG